MTENTLQLISIAKILTVVGFSWFYGSGGISGKWKRRFMGAAFLVAGVSAFSLIQHSFSFWYLTYFSVSGALSLPYGAEQFNKKILLRSLQAAGLIVSPLAIFIANANWPALVLHIIVCLSTCIIAGVFNSFRNARDEETLIAGVCAIIPMFIA